MKKVIVIKDNADNMRLVSYALRQAGYYVVPTGTVKEGVESVLRERPLFVIMDIDRPGTDELEGIRLIRKSAINGSIPIVSITSLVLPGDRKRLLQAGCTAYFAKPIDPLTIVESIHTAIGVDADRATAVRSRSSFNRYGAPKETPMHRHAP